MSETTAKVLAHVSNLGVVHMPGRSFPGIVIQGDTLASIVFRMMEATEALRTLKADEDTLIGALGLLKEMVYRLEYYDEVCEQAGYKSGARITENPMFLELMREYDRIMSYD